MYGNDAVMSAYIKAYLHRISITTLFPTVRVSNFLKAEAIKWDTRVELLVAALIGNASALMGPGTKVEIKQGYQIQPNVFILGIGDMSLGKSTVFRKVCAEVLSQIEQQFEKPFRLEEYSRASLLKVLNDHNGYGYICADEFCNKVDELFKDRNTDSKAFRANLNAMWSGGGFQKDFAAKTKLSWSETYLSIFGLTQPGPFVEFFGKLLSVADGLADRFMTVSAPIAQNNDFDMGNYAEPQAHVTREWCLRLFSEVYKRHHLADNENVTYRLSQEAFIHWQEVRDAAAAERDERFKEAETKILADDHELQAKDIPKNSAHSKDLDIAVALATILHVLNFKLKKLIRNTLPNDAVPTEIPLSTLQAGMSLISVIRFQETYNQQLIVSKNKRQRDEDIDRVIKKKRRPSIHHEILMMPGTVISARMVTRTKGRPETIAVIQAMKDLSKNFGEPKFVGIMKTLPRRQIAFYKAAPFKVDFEYLRELGIYWQNYWDEYQEHLQECPVKGLDRNWNTYYANLKLHAPTQEEMYPEGTLGVNVVPNVGMFPGPPPPPQDNGGQHVVNEPAE